jgi:protein gp37
MGENSGVDWTDASVSFWMGCRAASTGCQRCYARRDMKRFGRDFDTVIRCSDHTFYAPLRWEPKRIFVCPWSDFFIADADRWRTDAWDVIRRTPQHTWLILTKRPGRIPICLPPDWGDGWEHVWLGASAENQATADERIPLLLKTPAAHRWVSAEPLLGAVDFTSFMFALHQAPEQVAYVTREMAIDAGNPSYEGSVYACEAGREELEPIPPGYPRIDWLVVGGESGIAPSDRRFRPMDIAWVQSLVAQCDAAGVPVYIKQAADRYPGRQGRIPDALWARKDVPWATGREGIP